MCFQYCLDFDLEFEIYPEIERDLEFERYPEIERDLEFEINPEIERDLGLGLCFEMESIVHHCQTQNCYWSSDQTLLKLQLRYHEERETKVKCT